MTKEELLRTNTNPPKGSISWQPEDNTVTFKGTAGVHDNEGEVSMSGSKKKRRFQWRRNTDSSKKDETQTQQNTPSRKDETQTQQNTPSRRSYSTSVNKGHITPAELIQHAPEQTSSAQSPTPDAVNNKSKTVDEDNYDIPESEFVPMGNKKGIKSYNKSSAKTEEVKDEETDKVVEEDSGETKKTLSYAELFKELNPQLTEEQKKEIAKKEKRKRIIAALTDGVGALSNLYFTSKGAPSTFDGRNTLSERNQIRYDKMMNDRKANEEAYRQGLFKAYQMDMEQQWRQDEADRNQSNLDRSHQLEKDKFAHTKEQSEITNKLNQDKFDYEKAHGAEINDLNKKKYEEDIRQFNKNMELQWAKLNAEKDKNAADSAYKRYVMNGGKNSDKNKRTVLTAEDGKEVSIHTGVWENAVPQLFNIMMEEGIDPYPQLSGVMRTNALKEMTPEEIENFVKGQWQKSPRAVTLMMHMSELDPYSMQSQTGEGFDKQFGNVTIPYNTWNKEMDNIFNLMMQEGGYGVYSDKDAALVKISKIGKLTSEDKEKIIMDHWQKSPQAKDYIQQISKSSIDDDNTAPYLKTNDNNDNTAPYLRNQ